MKVHYEPITITLAAGETRQIVGATRFFLFYDATSPSNVTARFGNSRSGLSASAALIKGFKNGPLDDVDVIEITNTAGGNNAITVVRGVSDFDYTRDTVLGSLTVADGGDVTQGAKADAAASADAGTFSLVALFKRLLARVTTLFDRKGKRVRGQTAAMTGTADETVIAAPAAGNHLVVTALHVYNAHAATDTAVAIKDGATELFRVLVRAGATGVPVALPVPDGIQLTSATALVAANITTGSDTRVAAFGYLEAD